MRRIILAILSTTAVLVFLLTFKTHSSTSLAAPPAAVGTPSGSSTGSGSGTAGGSGTGSGAGTGSAATPTPSSSTGGTGGASTSTSAKTLTGDAADTMYGPVQVQITVRNGKVTAADAIVYPTGTPHDQQINAFAIPQLQQETVAADSAKIDAVSGATYTSNGYIASLQSALDKAGI